MAYLSELELKTLGLKDFGEQVRISNKASIYRPEAISIGDHVRIDDFCTLSAGIGGIAIGDYVHIAVYSSLIGSGKITLSSFCNLSSRVSIYSSNDDYSGQWLTNPTIPPLYTGVTHADVFLGRHVIIGSGSIILPGVILEQGVAVGALSLIRKHCSEFGIYAGNPAKRIADRKRDLLEVEQDFLNSLKKS